MTNQNILVVDDDTDFAASMAEMFESDGYTAQFATSGRQAIAAYQQQKFDMVLLDIKMSGLDGVETFKELKKLDENVRAVMMTGYPQHYHYDHCKNALKAGVIDILDKPVDHDQLIEMIKNLASDS